MLKKQWEDDQKILDNRMALICSVIANSQGANTRPDDFLPEYPEDNDPAPGYTFDEHGNVTQISEESRQAMRDLFRVQ